MQTAPEDSVSALLAAEAVRAPRTFRGRPLAPLSRGLRDLHRRIIRPGDSDQLHDAALLYILAEAHALDASKRLDKRAALIAQTDDIVLFRARLTELLDELTDADVAAAKATVDELFALIAQAQTEIVPDPKKNEPPAALEALSPTTTPSPSSPSPETPAGLPTSSAGS